MKRLALTLALILAAHPALAAWSSVGSLGSNQDKVSGTTVVITTGATAEVGQVVIVCTCWDNTDTTDVESTRLSVADSTGSNTYTKALEYTNGNGTAELGATTAIFYSKITSELASGGTITVTSDTARVAKSATAHEFAFGAGSTVSVAGTVTRSSDAIDPGLTTISSLANSEYLWVHCLAGEGPETDAYTLDADYTLLGANNGTTGGGVASNMHHRATYRIFTGTTDTVDHTSDTADRDYAQAFVALLETAAAGGCTNFIALLGAGCK